MSDTALAIEAAQRLADWAIENGAAEEGVHDDLRIIEAPLRALQQPKPLTADRRVQTIDLLVQYDAGDLDSEEAADQIERVWS